MFGVIASLFSGGITGILGSIFTNVLNYFNQKQKNKHELALKQLDMQERDKDREFALKEAEMNLKITEVGIEGAIGTEEAKAFTEAQKSLMTPLFNPTFMDRLIDSKKWYNMAIAGIIAFSFGIVDIVKHAIRPGITIYVSIVFGFIILKAWNILEVNSYQWKLEDAVKIIMLCVDASIYMISMIYGFWFSDRRIAKFMMRLDDGNIKK